MGREGGHGRDYGFYGEDAGEEGGGGGGREGGRNQRMIRVRGRGKSDFPFLILCHVIYRQHTMKKKSFG